MSEMSWPEAKRLKLRCRKGRIRVLQAELDMRRFPAGAVVRRQFGGIQGGLGYGLKSVTKVFEAQGLPCGKIQKRAARHGQPLGIKEYR